MAGEGIDGKRLSSTCTSWHPPVRFGVNDGQHTVDNVYRQRRPKLVLALYFGSHTDSSPCRAPSHQLS